ncbi:MAG: hypothetical protein NVSMB9_00610 [Isosphaeraceae bacterium]
MVRLRNAGCNNVTVPNDYVHDRNPFLAEISSERADPVSPFLDPYLMDTEPYLVLQLLAGETLESLLLREYPQGMDEQLALQLLLPVVRTLETLQQPWKFAGGRIWHCVYQDLKPSNLMIDPLGRLTLIDFGGCQVVVEGVPVLQGSCTWGYAPPECEGPPRILLACADVYSIGATLHRMVTGRIPDVRRSSSAITRDTPAPDPLPVSHCSAGLQAILERCLAPRPSQRFADARLVGDAISTLIN